MNKVTRSIAIAIFGSGLLVLPINALGAEQESHPYTTNAKFDHSKIYHRPGDDSIAIIPTAHGKGVTLEEMTKGFLLGKWRFKEQAFLGRSHETSIAPGTYGAWIHTDDGVWTIAFTDEKGTVKAVSKDFNLDIDERENEKMFEGIRANIISPPYPLTHQDGTLVRNERGDVVMKISELKGELTPSPYDPPCRPIYKTKWVQIDNPYSADPTRSKICQGIDICVYCCR